MSGKLKMLGSLGACFILATTMISPEPARAGKPGGGGGTPIPGVIFFGVGNNALQEGKWAMNADGTDKTRVIPAEEFVEGADILFPSYHSYGTDSKRDRWWVTIGNADIIDGTSGLGNQLYAYRSGTTVNNRRWVRLTNFSAGPDRIYAVHAHARWSNGGDNFISFIGYEYDVIANQVDLMAVYRLAITGAELELSLNDPNGFVPLEVDDLRIESTRVLAYSSEGYDWAPDGAQFVYSSSEDNAYRLRIHEAGTANSYVIPLPHNAYRPTWSLKDNDPTVAYCNTRIYTIKTDLTQSSPTLIGESGKGYLQTPVWSPTGDHVAYMLLKLQMYPKPNLYDTFRMTRTGGSKTDLTSASFSRETGESPIRWTPE
jgi:hypothetical protein